MANTATANSALTTDFNVTPYYDDYDEDNNYYRVLYKPGFAVQARELTQMQTILQKQIDRFGKHVFRDGSIVLPGQFGIEKDVDYIKVKDEDDTGAPANLSLFLNKDIYSVTNNVDAYVIEILPGSENSVDGNYKTLFIRYKSSSPSNTSIVKFNADEVLSTNTGQKLVAINTAPTGLGSRFIIREGVIFAKGHFLRFAEQSIVLSRYGTSPTCRVGFNISERIVKASDDSSLLDPALEASNYSAPGADRLQLNLELQVRDIDDEEEAPNFAELFTIKEGIIIERYDRSQYNILQDELAKRTLDESGNYYVWGLDVRVRENYDSGTNGGYSANGNSSFLSIGVEPGVGYVRGYEVGKLVTDYDVVIPKASTYANLSGQVATASMGNYVRCNNVIGQISSDTGAIVNLYDTAAKRVANRGTSTGAPSSGNIIGTARVLSVIKYDGILGTPDGEVFVYLSDIRMVGSNSFAQVKTINASGQFWADPIVDASLNTLSLEGKSISTLLMSVGSPAVRNLKGTDGSSATSFNFSRTATVSFTNPGTGGIANVTNSIVGEQMIYGTTSLTALDKSEIILSVGADINVNTSWTVSGTPGSNTIQSSGSSFLRFSEGDTIQFTGNAEYFTITSITNNTNLIIDRPYTGTGAFIERIYRAGSIIDLNSKSITTGQQRSVTTTPSTLNISLFEPIATTGAKLTYPVNRPNAVEINKELVENVLVKIDFTAGSGAPSLTSPINLGIPDVYKIKKILRRTDAMPTSTTDANAADVTRFFVLDNGQKDDMYDFATINPNGISLTANDRYLVVLDHFEPNFAVGVGYFSVDSYPSSIGIENIPIFESPTTKIKYDLRQFIDIRPVKQRTANSTTLIGSATTNPGTSTVFNYDTNGLRFPVPSSQITYDYSYYLPRRDVVVMDKRGQVSVISGNPNVNPITPSVPENVMALAAIYVAPFPSLAPNYAQTIGRKDLSVQVKRLANIRYTMRDIGVLKDRIVNLEYYAALTALEKSAIDMQILDENGNNRFKNGIFVDSFRDESNGDTADVNYRIMNDPEEKSIRPLYTMRSMYYNTSSLTGLVQNGPLIHLPFTHNLMIEQPKVTSYRNVEVSSYRFVGNLFLTPEIDVWVDTQKLADNQVSTGVGSDYSEPATTTWDQWQTTITGYKLYRADTGELIGTFDASQRDLAYDNAYWLARNVEFNKNTLGLTSSGKSRSGAKFETIVETQYDNTRVGSETFYSVAEDTVQLGNRVVDVSIKPYIRPQILTCAVKGMKAFTKLYVFFDGEDMTSYVSPLANLEAYETYLKVMPDPKVEANIVAIVNEGDPLVTDADGTAYFRLRLPAGNEKRFRTGQREVIVIDSPTNSQQDGSTMAKNYFVAQGLVQQLQGTILTTRTVIATVNDINESNLTTTQYLQKLRPSCSAYSFLPKAPDGEEGIFLTKVDLFFAQKHPTLGFWIEIREMDSGGDITRNAVPLSEVWVESSDPRYVVSDDASLATTIQFQCPIFLYNNVQYALVIHTIGLNPDTYIWISRLTEFELGTENRLSQRPLTGTFYTTNNNLNWDIVPDVDLKVNFYRASFTKNVEGTAYLGQKPIERLILDNVSDDFDVYGETLIGNQRLTLSSSTMTELLVNDILIGNTSAANSKVITYAGSVAAVASTKFVSGERVFRYYGANNVNSGTSAIISTVRQGSGYIEKYTVTSSSKTLDVDASNGQFYIGDTVYGLTSNASATITGIANSRYSLVDFEPSYIKFNKTGISFDMKATSNTGVQDAAFVPIDDNENFYFSVEKAVLSRSYEIASSSLNGAPSNNVKAKLVTQSEYVSPILDVGRTYNIFVDNIVNANTYKENYTGATVTLNDAAFANVGNILVNNTTLANSTIISKTGNDVVITVPTTDYTVGTVLEIRDNVNSTAAKVGSSDVTVTKLIGDTKTPTGGALINKYISKPVVLADGQDAEDIIVIMTAYRPISTDVGVWIRLINAEDGDSYNNIPWYKLEMVDDTAYSTSSDRNDFREYTLKFPASMMTGNTGGIAPVPNTVVQYTNSQGTLFSGFKIFSLKIGLTATNSAIVPRVADLRAIAVQV